MEHKLPKTLTYPIICLSRKTGVSVASSSNELARCNGVLFWRGEFYEGLKLVDADGQSHEVVDTVVTRPRSRFGIWLARLLDLPLHVGVVTKHTGPASLSEVRNRVLEYINDDPAALEEMTGHDVLWWQKNLSESKDTSDLVRRFYAGIYAC